MNDSGGCDTASGDSCLSGGEVEGRKSDLRCRFPTGDRLRLHDSELEGRTCREIPVGDRLTSSTASVKNQIMRVFSH